MQPKPARRFWSINTVKFPLKNIRSVAIAAAVLFGLSTDSWARFADGSSAGGTVITNQAHATYTDDTGSNYDTLSEIVTITVVAVASVAVSPDETTPSDTVAPHDRISRLFRVCNAGNTTDTFTLTGSSITSPATLVELYFDNDNSGTLTDGDTPIVVTQTATPTLSPAACIGVIAVVDTNDAPSQSTIAISITARSNAVSAANGHNEDTGTIINNVGVGARLTDPVNASLPPNKLVNGVSQAVVSTGNPFVYTIAFRNSGDSTARNVIMTDLLPAGVAYVPGSLELNDRSLSDALDADEGSAINNKIEIRLSTINASEIIRISFKAQLTGAMAGGTGVVNNASVTADNAAPVKSVDATVVFDPFGLVYSARGGASSPIVGARVELLQGSPGGNFLMLPTDVGFVPNAKNENPFATDAAGHFSFKLNADQIGGSSGDANYFLKISAPGFITRW